MYLTGKDLRRYLIYSLLFLWFILFSHLFYLYLQKIGQDKYVKGGVFIEAVVKKPVNPIPYIGNNYESKYVQSFFFPSCLNSSGNESICKIKTDNYKTFIVSLKNNNYWSDGRKITIDDLYFTFNNVLKENQFGLSTLNISNIKSIKKTDNTIVIDFAEESINNKSFLKNYILPKHIWENKNKDYYVDNFFKKFVTSSCVFLDEKSDYLNNIILDLSNCKNYYIDKYQLKLLEDKSLLFSNFTGSRKIDAYNGYENIDPTSFSKHQIKLSLRYSLFWNTKKQISNELKKYISYNLIKELKNDEVVSNRVIFNGYGLFKIPKYDIDIDKFKEKYISELENIKKYEFESLLSKVDANFLNYIEGKNNKFFVKNIRKRLLINGELLTGGYLGIGIQANSGSIYRLRTYKGDKKFKYVISENFKNIKPGLNTYKIYTYSGDNKSLLDTIYIYYKNIKYPKIDIVYPEFNFVYLNNDKLSIIGSSVGNILNKLYPGKVNIYSVGRLEYENILKEGNYDLVLSAVNFNGKDISSLFKTSDPIINPSKFVNKNFSSLIKQNLLAPLDLKKDVFFQLNKIYQEHLPVIFLGNAKEYLFVRKKYNIEDLDYSVYENRKKMLQNIILKKIKQPVIDRISFSGFIEFLSNVIDKGGL